MMLMRQKQNQPQTKGKMKNEKRGNQTNLLSIIINFFSPWTMQTKMIQQRKNSKTSLQMQNKSKAIKPPNCSNRVVKKKNEKRKTIDTNVSCNSREQNHVANHPYDCEFPLSVPVTKRQQKEKKKKKFIYLSFEGSLFQMVTFSRRTCCTCGLFIQRQWYFSQKMKRNIQGLVW